VAWTPTIIMKYYKDLLEHPGRTARNLSSLRTDILAAGMLSTEPIALPRPVQGSSQSRGENVDPTEVEGLLLEDPRINHVAVVGLPEEWLAEVPRRVRHQGRRCGADRARRPRVPAQLHRPLQDPAASSSSTPSP
jgi:acyl-CoA synthetase (AMP-forming)/AMP-acid ligase II